MKVQRKGESSMTNIFMTIVNMSITATFAAFLILVFRSTIGRKFPKVLSYALWAIVLLRLILPFSFTSTLNIEKTSDYRFSSKFILPIILSEELPIRAVNFPGSAIH